MFLYLFNFKFYDIDLIPVKSTPSVIVTTDLSRAVVLVMIVI